MHLHCSNITNCVLKSSYPLLASTITTYKRSNSWTSTEYGQINKTISGLKNYSGGILLFGYYYLTGKVDSGNGQDANVYFYAGNNIIDKFSFSSSKPTGSMGSTSTTIVKAYSGDGLLYFNLSYLGAYNLQGTYDYNITCISG